MHISLTQEGRRRCERYHIDALQIQKQKRWDGTWRILLFDVLENQRTVREALRGKLKELGFYKLQKSVWVHAFPCKKEITTLRNFFGLGEGQYMCLEVSSLPSVHTQNAKAHFNIA